MKFWKMNGAGNDFILIDDRDSCISDDRLPEIAKTLCRSRMSIGADGMMVVHRSDRADLRMLFFNSDGSVGEMCGNGARCICRYAYEAGLSDVVQSIETTAGIVKGERLDAERYRVRLNDPTVYDPERSVEIDGADYSCAYVELGSPGLPHAVLRIPGLRERDPASLFALGRKLRYHPAFPKGANVNFYDVTGPDSVLLLTYERGVEDFTYACGTGTGSTAVALFLKGLCGSHMRAEMRGGVLETDIVFENGRVSNLYLTGSTNVVAVGEITDSNIRI